MNGIIHYLKQILLSLIWFSWHYFTNTLKIDSKVSYFLEYSVILLDNIIKTV